MLKNPFTRYKLMWDSSEGGADYGGNQGNDSGGPPPSTASNQDSGPSLPTTNTPEQNAFWSDPANTDAGREAAARGNTESNPVSDNGPSTPYTDPRTGLTFSTPSVAEYLGYGTVLTTGTRTDAYAQAVAALPTRAAQDAYMARNDDPFGLRHPNIVALYPSSTPPVDASIQYYNRPDIYPITDPQQKTLIGQGYTPYQAAEQLRYGAQLVGDTRLTDYYENLRDQAKSTGTGKGAAYHAWAGDTGLPQSPSALEYMADLYVYSEKGYPTLDKNRFSPVDATILNLPGGLGSQEYAWNNTPYDFRGVADVLAKEQATGAMGPYGQLPLPFSSGIGSLSIGTQQAIGAAAATSKYLATPDTINYSIWGAPSGKSERYVVTAPSLTVNNQQSLIDNLQKPFTSVGKSAPIEQDGLTTVQPTPFGGGVIPGGMGLGFGVQAANEGTNLKPDYSSPMSIESGMNYGLIQKPFISNGKSESTSDTYFGDITNFLKGGQNITGIYNAGAVVPQNITQGINSFVKDAPILSSIYQAGGVFELKSDYEKLAAKTNLEISPMLNQYTSDLSSYNTNLGTYNTRLENYNKAPTKSEYNALKQQEGSLSGQKSALDLQQSAIQSKLAPVESAESRYNTAAGNLMGNQNQKNFLTYGVGNFFGELGTGYQKTVETPIRNFVGEGPIGQFISGVASVPRQIAYIGQTGLIGGEGIIRDLPQAPGIATAGLAMQAKGTYEMGMENPTGLVGSVVGMFALGAAVGAVGTKMVGLYRTSGFRPINANIQEGIPIKNIGYPPEVGYPLQPQSTTSPNLIRSFSEGKLYPAPKEMNVGKTPTELGISPPYLHGEGGVPVARLPNAAPTDIILWTAHESESLAGGIKVGDAYKMTGTGTSELNAISGAPVLESYFAKVGGQIPKTIGFDNPIKTPTAYATVVSDLEIVPNGITRNLPRTSEGGVDYTRVNDYMQTRLTDVPGGQGFIPMIKGEYEANIPTNTIFEVTGRRYYTKVGGFGESHFLGTRIPIIEQTTIGFEPGVVEGGIPTTTPGSSYRNSPLINLAYSPFALSMGSVPSPKGISSASSSKIEYPSIVSSKLSSTESPAYQSRSNNYVSRSPSEPAYSSAPQPYSETPVSTSYTPQSYKPSYSDEPRLPSSPSVPYSPTTIPYSPRSSTPHPPSPLTTTPPFPLLSSLPISGGNPKDGRKRRRKVELFSFEMGEDTPIPTRYGLAGQTLDYVPGSRGIAANILSPRDIAPNSLRINVRNDDRL